MAGLLVSVRSALEAEAALAGGADLIDVKEPAHGSLGRARDETIAAVIRTVADRLPVSAALGEFRDTPNAVCNPGLEYAKWGLAGCQDTTAWFPRLAAAAKRLEHCRPVAVAYADWQGAEAPPPPSVLDFAIANDWPTLLLDTWHKDGRTLLDWLTPDEVLRFCGNCRQTGIRVALAGSLGPDEIEQLLPVQPDWFAVRSAACRGGRRENGLCAEQVQRLARLIGRLPSTPR